MPDFTRFDFHAVRFMNSETVEAMNAEEVGQYILLLCKSWINGDDCSLPDDVDYLSRIARVTKISEKVLSKFPVIQIGSRQRRRNEVLYNEWLKAIERAEIASEKGYAASQHRWSKPSAIPSAMQQEAKSMLQASIAHATGIPIAQLPYNTRIPHTVPDQTVSNQAESEGNFHNIAVAYRTAMGKSHSKAVQFKEQYSSFCLKYGEDAILEDFKDWADSNLWRKEKLGNRGLFFYFKDLPERMDEISEIKNQSEKKYEQQQKEIELAFVTAQPTETEKLIKTQDAEREQEKAAREKLLEGPFAC